jgi:predicted dienelactone hydrolase
VPSLTVAVLAAPALGLTFTRAGLQAVQVPVQLWRAEKDADAPDEWNSGLIRARLPHPPEEHVVPAARHTSFLPPCRPEVAASVPAVCSDPPGFDRTAFHQTFLEQVVTFFRAHLAAPPVPEQQRPAP